MLSVLPVLHPPPPTSVISLNICTIIKLTSGGRVVFFQSHRHVKSTRLFYKPRLLFHLRPLCVLQVGFTELLVYSFFFLPKLAAKSKLAMFWGWICRESRETWVWRRHSGRTVALHWSEAIFLFCLPLVDVFFAFTLLLPSWNLSHFGFA